MKKSRYIFIILFQIIATVSFAQQTSPGDPGGDPSGDDPIGGGAPIGGGTIILMGLAAAYGAKKLYHLNKEEIEE